MSFLEFCQSIRIGDLWIEMGEGVLTDGVVSSCLAPLFFFSLLLAIVKLLTLD